MQNLEEIKTRFLKNDLSMRLGCIASDLARIESFSKMPNNQKVIKDLVEESKFFIEWTAPDASIEIQEMLVELQIQLARIEKISLEIQKLADLAQRGSKEILELSGLVHG